MSVSFISAAKNVFRDKDFMPNYTALVVSSFCYGLIFFASVAQNTNFLLSTVAIAIITLIYAEGYHLHYFKSLISDGVQDMPQWSNFTIYLKSGLKYSAACCTLGLVIFSAILFGLTLTIPVVMMISKFAGLFLATLLLILSIICEMFMLICIPAFFFIFTDSEESIISFLNIKKLCRYFDTNYFIILFTIGIMTAINSFLSIAATVNIKYSLTYIIPLMISPIVRLIADNLMAQAYVSHKNAEKGSVTIMCILFPISIGLILSAFYLLITLK